MPFNYPVWATLLVAATQVAAHGHVTNIVVNGVYYAGWDINTDPYMSDPPKVAAWQTPNTANGFISPDQYNSSDIICHLNATNAEAHVVVAAGDSINLQWTDWPESHHGPVIDYLASCDGSCESVDKTSLKFFKIDGVGLVSDSAVPGTWGDDQLIANNNSWMVKIPESIAPGNYVLRHEIIALHSAGSEDGAQNYPQCFNLQVTGSGSDQPTGVLGTALYTPEEAGILVNIYSSISSYTVPGPTMYSGATSISQATSAITSTGTAVTGSGSAATTTTTASATSAATSSTTSDDISSMSSAAKSPATSSVSESRSSPSAPSTLTAPIGIASSLPFAPSATRTTMVTKTKATSTPSSAASSGTAVALYYQCGGRMYTGSTTCVEGAVCHEWNEFYSQCISA
ncbi:hypothetical protein P175DRAFT_0502520 [Aspergillus ochraceoroseus IBT 24754]|uniref:AA9 family lytic polysaccharide monooxygenase n=2 Tax=Aspergillus ochraceoroseus TaxID=138278 RepID=A0A2T5LVU3_9EURO|nr:uncharacterized protein P175DRAFT_0502520 [Aspergillus ochraceoroseus IBT 24754]KKK21382.1 hypothetical protein AOCH_000720 [Aspergillus ochraceoroseus]PTU20391.1 hypothetical protein P175DRAFT_0502520 [Aspergillus ochraceoroseus IBT 24754]